MPLLPSSSYINSVYRFYISLLDFYNYGLTKIPVQLRVMYMWENVCNALAFTFLMDDVNITKNYTIMINDLLSHILSVSHTKAMLEL